MLKKTISKIMAVAMLVSSIGQLSLLNTVSTAEQLSTNDVWIDFEDYNLIADVPTDETGAFYLATVGTTAVAELATIDGNKSLKLVNTDTNNYNYFRVKFNEEVTKNSKVVIEYDMMSKDEAPKLRSDIYYNESDTATAAMIQSTWKNSVLINSGGKGAAGESTIPKADTWYHVKHELDIAKDTAYTVFTDKVTGTAIWGGFTDESFTAYEYLRYLDFHHQTATGKTTYFDNIKVDYVYDVPNPEVKLYAGETVQNDLTAVSTNTDSIKVDFNTVMDETTLTGDNVYVMNTVTKEKIGAKISYADGVAALALTNGVQKGVTYELVITSAAVNPDGIGANADKTVQFTVSNTAEEDKLAEDVSIDFENMSISDIPIEPSSTVPYYLDTIYEDKSKPLAGTDIVDINGNKAIKVVSVDAFTNRHQFVVNFDEEASKKAKITVEYDMMTQGDGAGALLRTELFCTKDNEEVMKTAAFMKKTWISSDLTGNGFAGSDILPAVNTWYHVKHEMDIANATASTVFTDKATGTAVYNPATVTNFTWADSLKRIGFHCYNANSDTIMFFDNIKVSYEYEEPKVTADSVKLYADGVEQTDKTGVSPLTDSITVDFGTEMNADTLTGDNFYVTNKATGAKVATALKGYSNGVAELEIMETLDDDATYVLNITDGVLSESNIAVSGYTPVEFTVTVDVNLPAEVVGENLVIDFEHYNLIADVPTDQTGDFYLATVGTTAVPEIAIIDGNKSLKLVKTDSGDGYNYLRVNFNKEATKNSKVVIEYDMMSDQEEDRSLKADLHYNEAESATAAIIQSTWKTSTLISGENGTAGNTDIPKINTWYHVKHEIDIANDTASTVFTDKATGDAVWGPFTDEKFTAYEYLKYLSFHETVRNGHTTYFDNITINYVYDAPKVTADSVTLTNTEGAIQENWNNISLITKAVKVDFGAVMDTATLTSENVYLENTATGDKVDAIFGYADGVLTMSPTKWLAAESNYKLVISDKVTNVKGEKVQYDTPLTFTTGKSVRTAVLTGAYVGTTKVTELAELKSGDNLAINVSYANSTNEEQTVNVIIAYYSGNTLTKAELVKTENIPASVVTMNYIYNHTVADLTDITKVKIFSWDGFTNMVPLSTSITLD